jgi:hypothetical protein
MEGDNFYLFNGITGKRKTNNSQSIRLIAIITRKESNGLPIFFGTIARQLSLS